MQLRSLQEGNFQGKNVLMRVDFNVELDDLAHVQEGFKLLVSKKSIEYVFAQGAQSVTLLSHYGRPDGRPDPAYSLQRMVPEVSRVLGYPIVFVPDCTGKAVDEALATLPSGSLLLLENVRFRPEEEMNDPAFAAELGRPFDCFVNEAFSACHRAHASVHAVVSVLDSFAGLRLIEEIERLDAVKYHPTHPAVAVIGGAKIETKLPLIRAMEESYDCVLVGGKIANEALDQKLSFSEKVLLPRDFDSPKRLDIGKVTASYYAEIIKKAKTVVWNGPMGKFEEKPYDFGTNVILEAMLASDAYVVIGGGESLAVVESAGVLHKIGFVSSGGGAMLEYLSGKDLPGIQALLRT
jgi:phosphoglycerate kinase